jgi:hypothetical protein
MGAKRQIFKAVLEWLCSKVFRALNKAFVSQGLTSSPLASETRDNNRQHIHQQKMETK